MNYVKPEHVPGERAAMHRHTVERRGIASKPSSGLLVQRTLGALADPTASGLAP